MLATLEFDGDVQCCRFNVLETDGLEQTMEQIVEASFGQPTDGRFIAQGVRKEPVFLVLSKSDLEKINLVFNDWAKYKAEVLEFVRHNMNTVVNWRIKDEDDDGEGVGDSPKPAPDDSV